MKSLIVVVLACVALGTLAKAASPFASSVSAQRERNIEAALGQPK